MLYPLNAPYINHHSELDVVSAPAILLELQQTVATRIQVDTLYMVSYRHGGHTVERIKIIYFYFEFKLCHD